MSQSQDMSFQIRSDQCEKSWGAQGLELLAPEYLSSSSMAMLMVRVSMVKTTVMHINLLAPNLFFFFYSHTMMVMVVVILLPLGDM